MELSLVEVALLPAPWHDLNADAPLQQRRTTQLRQELGENHSYPWGMVRCAATCGERTPGYRATEEAAGRSTSETAAARRAAA